MLRTGVMGDARYRVAKGFLSKYFWRRSALYFRAALAILREAEGLGCTRCNDTLALTQVSPLEMQQIGLVGFCSIEQCNDFFFFK